MPAHNLKSNLDEATEDAIQSFWSERPMIHPGYGFDIDKATPDAIFAHVERLMRDKGALMQAPGAPLLSNYIDYDALRGQTALDIGYGVGWLTNELAKVCTSVEGIDLSKSHHAFSSYRFRDAPHVNLQIASAEEIPFPDDTFDFVSAYGVLHHASDDIRCYREVHRVLKPGGHCFLMVYRRGGPKFWWHKVVRQGLFGGGLRDAGWDFTRYIYSITDKYQDDSPGAPISRHYSRAVLLERFAHFAETEISVCGNEGEWDDLPFARLPLTNLLPKRIRHGLVRRSGAYWMLRLRK